MPNNELEIHYFTEEGNDEGFVGNSFSKVTCKRGVRLRYNVVNVVLI